MGFIFMKKVNMNVAGNSEANNTNVLSLFSTVSLERPDPLTELLNEAEVEAWEDEVEETEVVLAKRVLVTENQFPDQSLFTLEQQLESLSQSLGRLKFYLNDLDDLLPSKLN